MANPVLVDCPQDEWTKVADGVAAGMLHPLGRTDTTSRKIPKYYQTYRVAGDPKPDDTTDLGEAVLFTASVNIQSASAIDVYVICVSAPGKVRVDL